MNILMDYSSDGSLICIGLVLGHHTQSLNQNSQHYLLKDYLFPIILSLLLCQRSFDHTWVDQFLGSLFCFINLLVYSFTKRTLSGSPQLNGKCWSQIVSILFSFNIVLAILGILPFQIKFRISLLILTITALNVFFFFLRKIWWH